VTSGVNERPYLSIGEVLGLLLEEFPDVTISKIRFLESQGLIEPERTSSGYRKFYDGDVERLKVILREQRENFLPLRVIRDRLEARAMDDSGGTSRAAAATAQSADGDRVAGAAPTSVATKQAPEHIPVGGDPTVGGEVPAPQGEEPRATAGAPVRDRAPAVSALEGATPQPGAARQVGAPLRGEVYSRAELCSMACIGAGDLEQLESFGIVAARGSGPGATFTDSDLVIAQVAAGFLARGIDARHLRSWRQSAEREAGLFEQRILPLLRQRNPRARHDAAQLLNELADLGAQLRAAIVAATLRQHLDP
jgi:DNA-binding transcriptional MerR regulator